MENLKEQFIRKWSTWFALEPNAKELREAFRKELDELLLVADKEAEDRY